MVPDAVGSPRVTVKRARMPFRARPGQQGHSLRVRRRPAGRSRVNGKPAKQQPRGVPCQSRSTHQVTRSPAWPGGRSRNRSRPGPLLNGRAKEHRTFCSLCLMTWVMDSFPASVDWLRRRTSTESRRGGCGTRTCTRRRCAHRAGRASSPAATITPMESPASWSWQPAFLATTGGCRSRMGCCPRC